MQNKKIKKILSSFFMVSFISFLLLSNIIKNSNQTKKHFDFTENFDYTQGNKYGLFLSSLYADINNDYKQLFSFYDEAVSQNNKDFLGKSLLVHAINNNQDEVFKLAQQEYKKDTKAIIPVLYLSNYHFINKDYKKAYTLLSSLGNKSDTIIFKLARSWALMGQKKYDEALDLLETEIDNPAFKKYVYMHLAIQSELAGDIEYATELYDEVFDIGRLNIFDIENIASFYLRHNNKEKALNLIKEYYEKSPDFLSALVLLNSVKNGTYKPTSVDTVNKGMAKALLDVSFILNSVLSEVNDLQLMYISMINNLYPDFFMSHLIEAELKQKFGDTDGFLKISNAIPKTHYLYLINQLNLASYYMQSPTPSKGTKIINALIKDYPEYPHLYIKLASYYSSNNENMSAIKYYTKALDFTTNNKLLSKIYWHRGQIYDELNYTTKAKTDFEKSLELQNEDLNFLNAYGYFLVKNDLDIDKGLSLISKAMVKEPLNPYFLDSYGWALFKQGKFEKALLFLETAKKILPQNPTIIDHLADVYWTLNRKNEAIFEWKKVLSANENLLTHEKINLNKIRYKINYGI